MNLFIDKLKNKKNLSFKESKSAFEMIMDGQANEDDIYEDFAGIRPKIKFDGSFNDFLIQNEYKAGYPNFINLIGIDSPGLTSCLAIAQHVESLIL